MKTFLQCIAIGTGVTLALFGLGYLAADYGAQKLSYVLYWQAYAMQMAVPCSLDSTGEYLCMNLQLARVIFWAGLPVGVAIYSTLTWIGLALVRRRPGPPAPSAPMTPRGDD